MGRPRKDAGAAVQKPKTTKVKGTRKKKDPNAPKRAQSAYMLWLSDNRARLTKPGMGVVDVSRAAGVEWANVKDKSKWEKLAAEEKKRYEKEMAAFKAGLLTAPADEASDDGEEEEGSPTPPPKEKKGRGKAK